MSDGPTVLLVDSNPSDRDLAVLVLQRNLPEAAVTALTDPLSVGEALGGAPEVAVVAADLTWANVADLLQGIKRRSPLTRIVLFGSDADIASCALGPGLACDGVVRKGSAGFLALAAVIAEALARSRPAARDTPMPPAAVPEQRTQEMRDVALVFSHDLREPVQQIARLARNRHPDQSGVALGRVLECAERAGDMLDRMIEYLNVSGRDESPRPVDLTACLSQALENLRTMLDDSGAEIHAASLPRAMGNEYQVVHLFQNLISNAIKFRGRERPVVTIQVEARDSRWLLAFRDNGIGIPQALTEQIFEIGKRLHSRDEYPGTGIGLALCRRIVERQGGRIWAESEEGKGSTFFVLLPRAAAAATEVRERVVATTTVPGVS